MAADAAPGHGRLAIGMDTLQMFVEAEAGSNLRGVYDEATFEQTGTRRLVAAHPYPYGFVLGTMGPDGAAVDCYLLTDSPVAGGTQIEIEPVGLLEQLENGEPDHKLLAVLPGTPRTLDPGVRDILDRFIRAVFAPLPRTSVTVGRLLGPDAAERYVASHRR